MKQACSDEFSDVESLQTDDRDVIKSYVQKTPITEDREMLKTFLFELGCAVGSYREKKGSQPVKTVQNDIVEITMLYSNENGDLSFGLERTHDGKHKQSKRFFPSVFKNLNQCFTGKTGRVLFFASFESILGSAVTYEYLGGIPTYPSLSSNSPAGSIQLRLESAARSCVLKQRALSYFQTIGRLIGKQSTAHFSHQLFYPLLFRYATGHNDVPDLQDWIALLLDSMERMTVNAVENTCALPFHANLPETVVVDSAQVKFMRFLAYQCFDWFVKPTSSSST